MLEKTLWETLNSSSWMLHPAHRFPEGCNGWWKEKFYLVSLFNDISTFVDYLIPTRSLPRNNSDIIEFIAEGNRIHTFPKGISPKVNVIAKQEFELAYFVAAVQYFNHYATGNSRKEKSLRNKSKCAHENVVVLSFIIPAENLKRRDNDKR